jgi:hypothetical protein
MRRHLIAICSLVGLFPADTSWAADRDPTSLRSGDYLEDGFLKILETTRSPYSAVSAEGHAPQSISVARDGTDLVFGANDNWHEGYTLFRITASGEMKRGEAPEDYRKPLVDSPSHFRFIDPETGNTEHGYTYCGDADKAVAKIALVGKYQDTQGRKYEFGADGILTGLGPRWHYSLDNDHVIGDRFDYVELRKADSLKGYEIAFKRDGSRLKLYHMRPAPQNSPDTGIPDFTHTFLVLKQITPPLLGCGN